ncbi:P-loop containing nucleoside triphosphate hydrolase protein [Nemania abortiva]|nr:P-loop containing nucleoside triphosphate hydrolase protein [Nemania abortiva]
MPPEQPEPELGLLRRRTTGKLEGAFDAWQFKIRLNQDVPSHIVKQLQKECGADLVRAIDRFHEMEAAQRRTSLTGVIEAQPEENPEHTDPKGRKDIIVRDQYWDKSKRRWVLKKVQPGSSKKYMRCVLFVRRVYSERMIYDGTVLVVKGPILRNALRNIFRCAQGFGLTDDQESELKGTEFLFWAQPELQLLVEHYKRENDDLALFEINTALKFVEQEYSESTLAYTAIEGTGLITFDKLWTIFAPDCLVVGKDYLGATSIWRARSHETKRLQNGSIIFEISGEYLEWDGKKLGNVSQSLVIPSFEGVVAIVDLAFSPLKGHPQENGIKERILKRSERKSQFCKLGYQIQEHEGLGLTEIREKVVRYKFQGRVILDPAMLAKVEPNNKLNPSVSKLRRLGRVCISELMPPDHKNEVLKELLTDFNEASANIDDLSSDLDSTDGYSSDSDDPDISQDGLGETTQRELSTEEKLLLSSYVYGYSLKDAKWGTFSVDRVSDVKWENSIFDSLVMDVTLKETIYQLIKAQSSGSSNFDDFVKGKGRGLVGLLFGPPGTGKTLTAEAIAETAEMPLYMVSSGSLGHEADDIYMNLSSILELATHWKAVLLLDEADVFLAKRTTTDLKRNAIVSVFLRELEYYQGILLLTTNKARIIDEAFQSRIHFCHRYPNIDFDSRRQIWKTFMNRARESEGITVDVEDEGIESLAEKSLNGRQIKNVMSMAIKVASIGNRVLTAEGILSTANLLQNFDFSNDGDDDDSWRDPDFLTALSSLQARNSAVRAENDRLTANFNQSRTHSRNVSEDRSASRKAPRIPDKKPNLAVHSPKLQ